MTANNEYRKAQAVTYAAVCFQACDRLLAASGAPIDHLLGAEPDPAELAKLISQMMDYARRQDVTCPSAMPQAMVDAFTLEAVCQVVTVGPYRMEDFTGGLSMLHGTQYPDERERAEVITFTILLMADRLAMSTVDILEGLAQRDDGVMFMEADSPEGIISQLQDVLSGGPPEGTTLQ